MDRKLFNLKNIATVAVFSLIAFVGYSAVNHDVQKTNGNVNENFTFTSGDYTDPDRYNTMPPDECLGEETVCVINAPDSSGVPKLGQIVPGTGQTVRQRIQLALTGPGSPTTNETVLELKGTN